MGTFLKRLRTDAVVTLASVALPVSGLLVAALATACGSTDDDGGDAGDDAAVSTDAMGASFPREGFGALSGDCNQIDDELAEASPTTFTAAFDFASAFTDDDVDALSVGGKTVFESGNAGGSSLYSEVFAFEYLFRCEDAVLLKTENAIEYEGEGAITDFLVELDGAKIGVSVTRAVAFPFDDPYPVEKATELLEKKLADVLESSARVKEADRWQKQILAVLAYAPEHIEALNAAYAALSAELRADTLVVQIATNGDDDFIYCDGACP